MSETHRPIPDTLASMPAAAATEAITAVWREILGLETIEPDAVFFELGGDSLAAVRMLAAVEDEFGAEVGFVDFLDEPTVAAIARILAGAGAAPPAPDAAAPDAAGTRAPLSFAQERLWFLESLGGASAAYNMPLGVRVRGPLDAGALERALGELVRRHESLRTTFAERDGTPTALVAPVAAATLEIVDLRGEEDPTDAARRIVDELASAPLDLRHGPLMVAKLLRLGEDDHVLELVFHHIVCDGWSHVVIFRELGELYRAVAAGAEPALGEPAIQYADYARRQRAQWDDATLAARVEPWAARLADVPFVLDLPTDRPRPAVPSYRGATLRCEVPTGLAGAVREFARAAGATQYATMLSAFYVLLARYSGQDEILVGATTAARAGTREAGGVGLFASTVALHGDLSGEPSFRVLVERVREFVLWALAHQDVPFEALVARLAPERDLRRHPLFQVFCAHVPEVPAALPGASPFDARPATSRFDLTLFVEDEHDGRLELAWEYATDLFAPDTIERMARQYLHLLQAALADPDRAVDELPLLDERERAEVLAAAGGAPHTHPVFCLHERFDAAAAANPEAVAVRFEGVSLTYGELAARANRLAHRLRAQGVGPDTLVALFLDPSPEIAVAILGVLKAGGAYVPLDPEYPAERLRFVFDDARAPLVVTQERLLERLPDGAPPAICLDDAALDALPASAPEPLARPEHLAYVIYTSGSTGKPKGVMVEHRNAARLFTATEEWFGFGPADTWVLVHSYAFDFSVWELWGALAYGGTLVISPLWTTRSPQALAELLEQERVTVLNATPSLFVTVAPELLARWAALALRVVVFGGEALQTSALRPWYEHHGEHGPTLVNMYGITETTVHVTYRPIEPRDCERDASPIGVPIPDLTLYVLDRHAQPVPFGVAGELYVGGAGVARGYLDRPQLTAERFVDNPFGAGRLYRSGDVARRTADGELDFRGRIDDQVKVRGFRIELGEIQAAVREVAAVADAAVLAVEATPGDLRLAAYLVAAPDTPAPALRADVLAHLEARLPEFMVPASLVVLDRLPLTRNGKIDRRALPAPEWEVRAAAGGAEPRTETERAIAEIWSEVLGIEHVAPEDGFFQLGGHSLLAARVVTRVRKQFAIELSVRALFEEPTLGGFAARVDVARAPAPFEPAPDAPDGAGEGPRPASYPLAYPQQQLLFFDELSPSTYNAALAIRACGELDVDALRRALAELFVRHEALRSVFVWGDAAPSQVVLDRWDASPELVDLSGLDEPERGAALERLMREHALRPFDLAHDLMLRTTVFVLAPQEHVILFQPHHIAFDAWAVEVLYRDLGELYDARRQGRTPALPELVHRYGDFALDQRRRMAGELLAGKLDFWRAQLAGAPTALAMPTDRPRPAMQSFDGASLEFELDAALADAVRLLAREADATPYMVLLATFATLLYRLGGQDDILIGGPMANRDGPRFEDVIGFFANTVVVRARLGGNPAFAELVGRVRESVLRSYEHQDVPFELVVEGLRPPRDPGRNPLFQVNFRVRVGGAPTLELDGVRTSQVPVDLGFARFELALELHLHDDRLAGELIYNTALWERASAERMAAQFEALLRDAVARPQTRLLALDVDAGAEPAAAAAAPRAGIRGFRGARGPAS